MERNTIERWWIMAFKIIGLAAAFCVACALIAAAILTALAIGWIVRVLTELRDRHRPWAMVEVINE
jgi:steroid 5-alpha reductase family enzyme